MLEAPTADEGNADERAGVDTATARDDDDDDEEEEEEEEEKEKEEEEEEEEANPAEREAHILARGARKRSL